MVTVAWPLVCADEHLAVRAATPRQHRHGTQLYVYMHLSIFGFFLFACVLASGWRGSRAGSYVDMHPKGCPTSMPQHGTCNLVMHVAVQLRIYRSLGLYGSNKHQLTPFPTRTRIQAHTQPKTRIHGTSDVSLKHSLKHSPRRAL